jgi:WD40 repeat protein
MLTVSLQPLKIVATIISISIVLFSCNNFSSKDSQSEELYDEEEGIHAAFYNSDGTRISMSTTKGRVILTDSTLNMIKVKNVHEGRANSSFFSLDDNFIITGGQDRYLKVSNAKTLDLEEQYAFNFNSWTSIHGFNTLGGCGENGLLVIYVKNSGDTLIQQLESDGAFHLYYIIPDTNLVVSSGLSGYEFDIVNNKIVHQYKGHKDWVYCIMPSNNHQRIVTASKDSTVKIFDRFTEENLYTSQKLDGAVYVACFSHSDDLVAASTSVGSIYFMDTTLSEVKMKIKAFDTHINTIHYSPDGNRILAGTEGGGAKIFSTITGELLFELDYSSLE